MTKLIFDSTHFFNDNKGYSEAEWDKYQLLNFKRVEPMLEDFDKMSEEEFEKTYYCQFVYSTIPVFLNFLKVEKIEITSNVFNNAKNCFEVMLFLKSKIPCKKFGWCSLTGYEGTELKFNQAKQKISRVKVKCIHYYHSYYKVKFFSKKGEEFLQNATSLITQKNKATEITPQRRKLANLTRLKLDPQTKAFVLPEKGFYLYGQSRKGKTWFLWLVLNYYADKLERGACCFAETNCLIDLVHNYMSSFNSVALFNLKTQLSSCRVLFLDDLGSENINHFARDFLTDLIETRVSSKKVTFITSNFSPWVLLDLYSKTKDNVSHEIKRIKAERLVLRIEEICDVFEVPADENIKNKMVI